MGRPVVPLSRDKDISLVPLSLCPGTRAGANVPGQNYFPKRTEKTEKRRSKTGKRCSITGKGRSKKEEDILKQK